MTRTIFLINTLHNEGKGYPRVYYGNGKNRVGEELITQFFDLKTLEEYEKKLIECEMRLENQVPVCPLSFLWQVDDFVEISFDRNNQNPSFRFLVEKERLK